MRMFNMLFSVQEGVQVDLWTDGHWAWAVGRPDRGGALVRVRGEVCLQGRHRLRRPEGTPQPQTCLLTQVRTTVQSLSSCPGENRKPCLLTQVRTLSSYPCKNHKPSLLAQVRTANLSSYLGKCLTVSSVLYLCWCLSLSFLSFFEYLTCCTRVNHLTLVYDKSYQTCHL